MTSKLFTFAFAASIVALSGCTQSRFSPVAGDLPDSNAKGTQRASTVAPTNWFNLDSSLDKIEGVGTERAYTEFGLKDQGEPVIVAVIDSGVDFNHEDLKDRMWVNEGEIAGNGIDDDKNGFIDDIHGWNFLGTMKDGKPVNVNETTLEVTRETVRMKKLKAEREAKGETLTEAEAAYLEEVSTYITSERESSREVLNRLVAIEAELKPLYEVLKADLAVPYAKVTLAAVKALEPKTPEAMTAKEKMVEVFTKNRLNDVARLNRLLEAYSNYVNFYYNEDFNPRKDIIGDDLNDFSDIAYGNNDVQGPDASHGTHVAGIIAANRNNDIGMKGVANNVRIMAIRTVPDGDEYDKDVANAVRYAANNGARVINMSFGKSYSSTNKSKVDAAFAYAAAKGVVIVHSAGNDGKENTETNNFPNKYVKAAPGTHIGNWIEVGASAHDLNQELPAEFSNYGKLTVDVFAPGVAVYSSTPGNEYASFSGTSMAGPVVAGVAALIISQNPELTGAEVRDLIRNNVRKHDDLEVQLPGAGNLVLFNTLSITGGLADVYNALKSVFAL